MKRKTVILLISVVVLFSACTNSKTKKNSEQGVTTSSAPTVTQTPRTTASPQPSKSPQPTKTPEPSKSPEASKAPTATTKPQDSTNSGTSKTGMTRAQAENLVKEYLKKQGEYIPSQIVVDSEDEKTFTVHCYDVIGKGTAEQHTATSGWYTVNKSTGEIKSMF